jgi:cold shock CspA family protein
MPAERCRVCMGFLFQNTFSIERQSVGKLKAEITTWYPEAHWGFATSPEGKVFFIHQSSLRNHRQVARVGSLIEFDVLETAQQTFLDKLNSGKYRDDPSFARSHRNRRTVNSRKKKPQAANVVVIKEGADAKV